MSGQPFHSLEIAATASLDTRALADAMVRASLMDPNGGPDSFRQISVYDAGAVNDAGSDNWLHYKWHAWWVLSGLWRDDLTYANGDVITCIVRPDAALAYVSMLRTLYASDGLDITGKWQRASPPLGMQLPTLDERLLEFPLIRPRLPASDWHLASVGEEFYLGRSARRVRATRQAGFGLSGDPRLSGFWSGVDEYEYVIDDELQVLLSVTGLVDTVPVATISVEDMNVDAYPPPGTFDFSPPPGTHIARVGGKTPRNE